MLVKINHSPLAQLDRMFDEAIRPNFFRGDLATFAASFRVDVSEDEKTITIEAELPGVKKEDAKIQIEKNHLAISAERKRETEETKKNYHRTERSFGQFTRTFVLGENIDRENIDATFENGVLRLVLPKIEPQKNTKDIVIK
ncbi:MAG: Hsp20/alpha crystallin family protein [Rhizobacter sp.]|nr:Hsp20/alpha crystallin family protein [Chlorobiales bacterium]